MGKVEICMKKSVKNLIEKYPILKKNRFYYHLQRYRQYRPCKVNYSLTTRPDILDTLVKDGIIVIKDYVSKDVCNVMIEELQETADQVLEGTYQGNFNMVHLKEKAFRLFVVDEISKTAKTEFFDDKLINEIAGAYVSEQAFSYRREADYKLEPGHFLASDLPHFDDWRHRFKAFLYLTDVGEENAPFVYYKGSHEQHPWKHKYHLEFEIDGEYGRYGHFFWQEWIDIEKKRNYEELVCMGKAGTLILADFRGVHKGTPLQSGKRILLNNTFGIALDGF